MKNYTFSLVTAIVKFYGIPIMFLLTSVSSLAHNTKEPHKAATPPTKITGKVVGEDGAPVAGANIVIKGSLRGYSSNKQGFFEFGINDEDQTLVITAMG